ncbi:cation diffusion facilitator family transporter [Leeuwenhoekiella sp. LLG6367-2.1]|uniref:cation diffusion facilitator family transporter n=1 Tax=Leeuwenhoekiella sp. LLG6367-2.1 TaxID=3160833 RepID=UPI00386B1CA0
MKGNYTFELPERLRVKLSKAVRLEWITLGYLITVVIAMYLVMGSSQAMKSAWLEDVLSLIPSLVFLISTRINRKKPNTTFPYGYHRVFSISFLTGAVALFGMGSFLLVDSSIALINAERPSIGNQVVFGQQIWMGWIMIMVLLYSSLPAVILGQLKLPLAKKLHNKVLYIDAMAQKADYMTALASILGILGIYMGLWWADAVAALFISFSVLKDGYKYLVTAIYDLMDRHPLSLTTGKKDPLIHDIQETVNSWSWVKESKVRFREHGQVYFGEIAVVVTDDFTLKDIEEGYEIIRALHWKITDFTIAPVSELPQWFMAADDSKDQKKQ